MLKLVKIFQDFITINKGEQVSVSFGMAPNNTNKRDLEIRIKTDFDGEESSTLFERKKLEKIERRRKRNLISGIIYLRGLNEISLRNKITKINLAGRRTAGFLMVK